MVGRRIAENLVARYRHVPRCWCVGRPRADVRGGVWAAAHPARGCRAPHSLLAVWRQVVGCRLRLPRLVAVPAAPSIGQHQVISRRPHPGAVSGGAATGHAWAGLGAGGEYFLHCVFLRRGDAEPIGGFDGDLPAHVFALVGGVWWEPFGGVFGGFLGVGFPVSGLEVDGIVGEVSPAIRIPLVGARIPGVP